MPALLRRILEASLLLWAMSAMAAPPAELPNWPMTARAHTPSAVTLTTALPALAASRQRIRPVPLDELRFATEHFRDLAAEPVGMRNAALDIPWQRNPLVSLVRNYKRDGLPIVHLYSSEQSVLALGLNKHGVPGIYFTKHLPD